MKLSYRMLVILIPLLTIFFSNCQKSQESTKQTLTIKDIWITDSEDMDGDGYVSYYRLNFDLDVNTGSKDVFIWVGIQFYDQADTAQTYYEYIETLNFTVEGSSEDDALYIDIGKPNGELVQAGYDFLFIVHDASEPDTRLAEASDGDDADLSNIPIESSATDIGVTIFDAWFDNYVDQDGDGYNSKATLFVDVDENSGNGAEVQLALYEKTSGSADYNFIGLTDAFTITGEAVEDVIAMTLDGFDYGSYDFMVELIFTGSYFLEDKKEAATWPDLKAIKMELASEDEPSFPITFNNMVYTDIDITISGYGTKIAPPGGNVTFTLSGNPGSFTYHAETAGYTTGDIRIGELVVWDYTKDVSGLLSVTYNLNVSSTLFYLRIQNSGTVDLGPLYVNYGTTAQTIDNIVIPKGGDTYRIGYYEAYTNTQVRAYWYGTSFSTQWDQGVDFTLPFTVNQTVTLQNIYKTKTNSVVGNEQSSPVAIGTEKPFIEQTIINNFKDVDKAIVQLGHVAKN